MIFSENRCSLFGIMLIQRRYFQRLALEPGLGRSVAETFIDVLGVLVEGIDRQQLGLDAMTEDARAGITGGARHGAAAQRAVDVDRSPGDYVSSRSHRAEHGDV